MAYHKFQLKRGFTIIELMVVITIIGLLASTVIASMSNARMRARDTSIRQQVKSMVQMAELHFNATGSYVLQSGWVGNMGAVNPTCATETFTGPHAADFRKLCQGVVDNFNVSNDAILHIGVNDIAFDSGRNYSIMALLNNGNYFCAGSSGRTYEGPRNPGGGNWTGAGCFSNP